jgi:hypothetical protein
MQIEIDFQVFKELTVRRSNENVSYNDVLRDILDIDATATETSPAGLAGVRAQSLTPNVGGGYAFRGGFLPNGSKLKALFKNRIYTAEIIDGKWVGEDGVSHATPTAACTHITGTATSYGRFWSVKRPNDIEWVRLSSLPKSHS